MPIFRNNYEPGTAVVPSRPVPGTNSIPRTNVKNGIASRGQDNVNPGEPFRDNSQAPEIFGSRTGNAYGGRNPNQRLAAAVDGPQLSPGLMRNGVAGPVRSAPLTVGTQDFHNTATQAYVHPAERVGPVGQASPFRSKGASSKTNVQPHEKARNGFASQARSSDAMDVVHTQFGGAAISKIRTSTPFHGIKNAQQGNAPVRPVRRGTPVTERHTSSSFFSGSNMRSNVNQDAEGGRWSTVKRGAAG